MPVKGNSKRSDLAGRHEFLAKCVSARLVVTAPPWKLSGYSGGNHNKVICTTVAEAAVRRSGAFFFFFFTDGVKESFRPEACVECKRKMVSRLSFCNSDKGGGGASPY